MLRRFFRRTITKARRGTLTIMAIPSSGGPPRSISVSFLLLHFGLPIIIGILAFLGISYLEMTRGIVTLYQTKITKEAVIESLQTENSALRKEHDRALTQLTALATKADQLSKTVGALTDEQAKIWAVVRGSAVSAQASSTRTATTTSRGDASRSAPVRTGRDADTDDDSEGQASQIASLTEARLEALLTEVQAVSSDLTRLGSAAEGYRTRLDHTPSIWPVTGRVTDTYGYRIHPITRDRRMHYGIDVAAPPGTPIRATANGSVAKSRWVAGYGNMIEISHGYGLVTVYGHNSRNAVKAGDRVKKGQVIGYVGSTGTSTGPHVHYEVRVNGKTVNPAGYMK